jgi:hypothetical protein
MRPCCEHGGGAVRTGDPVVETLSVASTVDADGIALAADASAYARRREARLIEGAGRRSVRLFPGVTVVPPGELAPAGSAPSRATATGTTTCPSTRPRGSARICISAVCP